jgi:hypothetical protein
MPPMRWCSLLRPWFRLLENVSIYIP